jgi:hypothetical protein
MKVQCLLFFWLNAILLYAQPKEGYMIFQSSGEVTLKKEGIVFYNPDGKQFLPGDTLTINNGWVSLLDNQMKRVTLQENCSISYEFLTELFKEATASMENKYLIYLWEKMNAREELTTKKGGVVRGEFFPIFPYDSAIILSDLWHFKFDNSGKQSVQLIIKDQFDYVIESIPTTDSVISTDSIFTSWSKPGKYFWAIRNDRTVDSEDWLFIIPTESEIEQIDKEIKELRNQLKDIPEPQFTALIRDIIKLKRWVF